MYNWITLLCIWNTVSQLYFNKIYILIKKEKYIFILLLQQKTWTGHMDLEGAAT